MKRTASFKVVCLIALVPILMIILPVSGLTATPEKTLKIGATTSFATKLGIQLKNVLELLAELTNESGGIVVKGQRYKIEYVIYDDKYDANAGRAAAERLVFRDKVNFIAGIYGSAPTLAVIEVTEPNKIPVFTGAATQKIYDPKYKYVIHSKGMISDLFGEAMFWKKQNLLPANAKTIVLAGDDDATGHSMCTGQAEALENAGFQVKEIVYYKRGTTDFTPVATKVKSLNPDIFQAVGTMAGAATVNLTKAMWESGWRGRIINRYAGDDVPTIVKELGKESVEGMVINFKDLSQVPNSPQEFLSFKAAYVKKYGTWETEALEWCAGYYLLLAAIKKANSLDPDEVMSACNGLKVSWLWGTAQLFRRPDLGNNRYCDCAVDIYVGQVRDGKLQFGGVMTKEFALEVTGKKLGVDLK